jgi:superfamily II DNA or RNA helicase
MTERTMPLPTLLDNRDDNTVLQALKRLLPEARTLDVATGTFEIGSLLALDSYWNALQAIRLLMGDETTKRTRNELVESLRNASEKSIEREKERDDSLRGLEAIRNAIQAGIIQTRVFTRAKFHSKAMLMKMKPPHLSNYGIIGSSNFTEPGLCRNVELNLLTTEQHQLNALWDWYEHHWNEAEEVTEELLKVIEPHLTLYSPFDVYAKALYEYFLGKELPATTWEEQQSKLYPMLDELQRRGYRQALKIAAEWGGALICDGVGFGKTYIGLMLIERFLHERKRIGLIVPKSARVSVWVNRLQQFFNYKRGRGFSTQIIVLNHTDLARENEEIQEDIRSIKEEADVILVDEAHHFRTPSAQRSEKLFEIVNHQNRKKQIFLLTATPVNNSLFDLLHLIEYFTGKDRAYFQKLGINDTRTHFVQLEKAVELKIESAKQQNGEEQLFPDEIVADAERILRDDKLFQNLVIQRSRSYARQFFEQQGGNGFYFPERLPPAVVEYQLAKVYGDLFDSIKSAFSREKPFVELALYNPESYRRDESKIRPDIRNREVQVITLIRATLLKRMESSYKAFEASLEDLLRSMARFYRHYAPEAEWERWKQQHELFWSTLEQHWRERFMSDEEPEEVEEDDLLPPPKEELPVNEFFMEEILASVRRDIDELAKFLEYIYSQLTEEADDKLRALVDLLRSPDLNGKKLVIFTQYRDTARYLYRELVKRGFKQVEELDSTSKKNREEVIKRFSPYYNCTDEELSKYLGNPINILISTDVLSEGLNLQDANLLINYDLHWNPVRLMQRIGRVDRRLDPAIEKKLGREKNIVRFWNFLPPDKLDELLGLYKRVSGKVLRISKTLGIEGKKLLRPEDDYEALRDFNAEFEGIRTADERLHLVLTEILQKHPALAEELPRLPKRLFSGKRRPEQQPSGVFAAYRFPPRKVKDEQGNEHEVPGECRWYFHQFGTEKVLEDLDDIHAIIQSQPETPRVVERTKDELRKSLKLIEQKKVNPELRNRQALAGEKATLVCWMEVV